MKKNLKLFFIALLSTLVAFLAVRFLIDTTIYLKHSLMIKEIILEATSGHWTKNGFVTWTDELIEAYSNAIQSKLEFVESSDVATYLYNCGYSITGKVLRVLSILEVLTLLLFSIVLIWKSLKLLLNSFVRFLKKLKRRLRKRHK